MMDLFPIDGRGRTFNAEGVEIKLSPAMQSLVHALNAHGHIDPIRDCGRYGFGGSGRTGTATIVALMSRGILREAKYSNSVHMPATTPAQVEEEAYAEDARRDAEQAAHAADPTRWMQTVNGEGDELHTRMTRTGRELCVVREGFRFWRICVPNSMIDRSAGGTFEQARAAADRFERDVAHAKADEQLQADLKAGRADGTALPVVPPFVAGDLVHDRATRGGAREFGTVLMVYGPRVKVEWPGSTGWHQAAELDPAPLDGTCMHDVPLAGTCPSCDTIKQATGRGVPVEVAAAFTPAEARPCGRPWVAEIQNCPRCGLGADQHPRTPAEADTGISDRTAAALDDVHALRGFVKYGPDTVREASDMMLALDRIEQALLALDLIEQALRGH